MICNVAESRYGHQKHCFANSLISNIAVTFEKKMECILIKNHDCDIIANSMSDVMSYTRVQRHKHNP